MNCLVLGYGSIGKRHAHNLLCMGHSVVVYDPAHAVLTAWDTGAYDAVVVSSPTKHHSVQAGHWCQRVRGVYVEKSAACTAQEWVPVIDVASAFGAKVAVGHNWRFHPAAEELRKLGPIKRALFTSLDDFYHWPSGKDHLGKDGIVLVSSSHTVDLINHLYGPVECYGAMKLVDGGGVALRLRDRRIYADDTGGFTVDIVNVWASPITASTAWGVLEDGWAFEMDLLAEEWREYTEGKMHYDCLAAFMHWVETGERDPRTCTAQEGLEVMEVLDQCREKLE